MNAKDPNRGALGGGKESRGDGPWFATFSLLDAGCAINSSQMQRLASITKLWRLTIGRLIPLLQSGHRTQ